MDDLADRTRRQLHEVVARALAEDVGSGDLTARATIPAPARARATMLQKQPGVLFGLDAAEHAFRSLDGDVRFEHRALEGQWSDGGSVLVVEGYARGLLAAERTALNLVQRLSGVATLTARYVRELEGTGARVLDTRKTTPGMRLLEKAAVRAGGGENHRIGLWDEMLVKDNHIAAAGGVGAATHAAIEAYPQIRLEVEVRDLDELDEALAAGATRLLLDNMTPAELRAAGAPPRPRAARRAAVARTDGRAQLEASGGITLQTIREVAQTGVHFVSVGALTHSAPALDLSLELEALP